MSTLQRAVLVTVLLSGCTVARDLSPGAGEHPAGWADPQSPAFHGLWLAANGDQLAPCQLCHGANYEGGAVGVSCTSQGCHTQPGGPDFCGTCHGGPAGPLPATAAHALHAAYCSDCHVVPATVDAPGHITGTAQVTFSGLARADGAMPVWSAPLQQCSNVYCHLSQDPIWQTPPAVVPCDTCHGDPPASHALWSRVATKASCATCHPVPPAATHVDGIVELNAGVACDACHGSGPLGAPPPGLDGSTDPTSPGVGAHQAHLDPAFPGRMAKVVDCTTCHPVPASITTPGHLDHGAPATVILPQGGAYDPGVQSCTVWCHWNKIPGPVWTDASGDALACDACHGFPPVLMRDGQPHTASQPVLSACLACHIFTPATHVDGVVELVP
jgi:predicted CxxxxCH...CXXCH cytochrome family protein